MQTPSHAMANQLLHDRKTIRFRMRLYGMTDISHSLSRHRLPNP